MTDGHGSTRLLVDGDGDIFTTGGVYVYDAFGNPLGFTLSSAGTTLLFSGEQSDQQTGLQYLRARYYNPGSGRFISWDPYSGDMEDPQSLHKYLYCHGDPINGFDPTGMFSLTGLSFTSAFSSALRRSNIGFYLNTLGQIQDVVDAFGIVNQWLSTGKLDYAGLGFLALSLIPFGKVMGKAKLGLNRVTGVSDDLTRFYLAAGKRSNKVVQAVGEMGAEIVARAKGYIPTGFIPKYHGFDDIYRKGGRFIIVEAKGGTSRLAKTQMSRDWIRKNIHKMLDDPNNSALGRKLLKAFKNDCVDGMVVTTKIIDNVVQDPTYVFKKALDIGHSRF